MSKPKCMKGLFGNGHPATQTVKVSFGGADYELDLCAEHGSKFDDLMWSWLSTAREASGPVSLAPVITDRLRDAPVEAPSLPEKFLPPPPEPVVTKTELDILRIRWALTDHARERIDERGPVFGFSLDDVLVAAEKPERAHRDRNGGVDLWVHWRGNVKVVVNRHERLVITVGGRDQELERVAV
jgi:hypothetical protein